MKISAVPTMDNSVSGAGPVSDPQASRVQALRTIKMNVNRTPGMLPEEIPAAAQELSISDNSETTVPAEATQPLSPQLAEIARQRRSLQVRTRELEDREKAFQEKSQGRDSIDLARLKSEPLNVLLEAGVTYDQLTEAILANQGNSEINALKAELAALKGDVDKKFVDKEAQAEQQVLAEMRKEATLLVDRSSDFELVRETKSVPDVMRLIEHTYRETGEVLEVREALKLVEEELFDRAKRLANIEKIKSQFAPPMPVQQQRPGIRTLTNKHTASADMSAKQRALLAFRGELK